MCARSAHRERVSAKLYAGGVQGPALGPLAGCRGRAPGRGPGGGAPGSSRYLGILNLEEAAILNQIYHGCMLYTTHFFLSISKEYHLVAIIY